MHSARKAKHSVCSGRSTTVTCNRDHRHTDTMICRGGEEVLLDVGGQDATEAFEDVGHSDEAREILDGLKVGTLKRMVRSPTKALR